MEIQGDRVTVSVETISTESVRFVKELYPRLKPVDATIEQYRTALENLPPIVIARGGVLVDGYHRWQAHVRESVETIQAEDLGDLSDTEIFNESIRRNATHGQQLSRKEKEALAGKLWQTLGHLDKMEREAEIAAILSASASKVREWTKEARKLEQVALETAVVDAWLNIEGSDRALAERFGVDHKTVARWSGEYCQLWQDSPPESRQEFDVWQFATADKDDGQQSYFGAVPPQVMENLLWFYTEPGDVVVDLFAGSGTTIEVAKRMGRRVWASDIRGNHSAPYLPIVQHDAATGWPDAAPRKAKLVFLDPPYWQQAAGRYSSEPGELAEMDLDAFYSAWWHVAKSAMEHAERVAFIISPTQREDGSVIDHATDMLRAFTAEAWSVERRIIVPYSTQQATGQQVTWCPEHERRGGKGSGTPYALIAKSNCRPLEEIFGPVRPVI